MSSEAPKVGYTEPWQNQEMIDRIASMEYRADLIRPDLNLPEGFELPVHNYAHGKGSGFDAVLRAKRAEKHGVRDIDQEVLPHMGCWHDTGYALRPGIDHQRGSREIYSAETAQRDLQGLGMPEPKIQLTTDGIKSTQLGVKCKTNTARCFRQSDLKNLIGEPFVFLGVTYGLYREQQIINGERIIPITVNPSRVIEGLVKYAGISHEVLTAYLEEDISLGDFDRDENGQSLFAKEAAKNVNLLVPNRLRQILGRYLGEIVTYTPVGI